MTARSGKARVLVTAVATALLLLLFSAGEARAEAGWRWPVEGQLITPYANDNSHPYAGGMHRGIDIAAALGTPVLAARSGEVTYAGELGYSGLTVAVRTVDGYVTSYLHLGAVSVRRGAGVAAGERLGEVGTTGRRSKPEPHLHFGVRLAAEGRHYVDPLTLLPVPAGAKAPPPPAPRPVPVREAPRTAPIAGPSPAMTPVPAARRLPRPHRVPAHLPFPVPARATALPEPSLGESRGSAHAVRPLHAKGVPLAPGARRVAPPSPEPRLAPGGQDRIGAPSDWGRPLALTGLALVVLALFGRSVLRAAGDANRTLAGRTFAAAARARRRTSELARAHLPTWWKAT